MDEPIYQVGNYLVSIITFTDPVLGESVSGYGVYNTTTGIREAEARRLLTARMLCDRFHKDDTDYAGTDAIESIPEEAFVQA